MHSIVWINRFSRYRNEIDRFLKQKKFEIQKRFLDLFLIFSPKLEPKICQKQHRQERRVFMIFKAIEPKPKETNLSAMFRGKRHINFEKFIFSTL